jgi:Protein of unknown function (DUF2892)
MCCIKIIAVNNHKEKFMKLNVGGMDRILRAIPLATGFFRFCPVYPILGVNTSSGGCGKGGCSK